MSPNYESNFVCECGKTFTSPQSFNGHKSNCKIHHLSKYGSLDVFDAKYKKVAEKCKLTNKLKFDELKHQQLNQWIYERHTCEKCGKIMLEKFGSGRFCSRSCANTREHSKDTLYKIKQSITLYSDNIQNDNINKYNENPSLCKICGSKLDYAQRERKTCSEQCRRLLASRNLKNNPLAGGLRKASGIGKHGWYKGYFCDSTYELVFVIYNIDNNIMFERNKQYYTYRYKGKDRKYYPDFIMGDGSFIELKGYYTDQVAAKISSVTDRAIKVLYQEDLKYAFDWVKQHYTYSKLEDLYESR